MNRLKHGSAREQRGLALVEMGLALVLAALVMAAMAPLIIQSKDANIAKTIAVDKTAFQAAVSAHFLNNRAAYVAAMVDGTGADKLCVVGIKPDGSNGVLSNSLTLHRCAIDVAMLRYLKVLPQTVREVNRYGETWVALFRLMYTDTLPKVPTGGIEMFVVSARIDGAGQVIPADGRRYEEATTAASFAGGQSGVVPDADRSTCVASKAAGKYEACGAGWKVNLADFLEPNELSAFASRLSN